MSCGLGLLSSSPTFQGQVTRICWPGLQVLLSQGQIKYPWGANFYTVSLPRALPKRHIQVQEGERHSHAKGRKPQKGPSPLAFLLLFPTSGHPPSIPDGILPLGSGAQSYLPGYGAGHTQTPPAFRTSSRQGLPCGVGTLTGTGQPRGQGCLSAPRMKGLAVLTRPRRPMNWDCLL